jgi:hypothetical protein
LTSLNPPFVRRPWRRRLKMEARSMVALLGASAGAVIVLVVLTRIFFRRGKKVTQL